MSMGEKSVIQIKENAGKAAEYLKLLASEQRLMILCSLIEGDMTVNELATLLGSSQPNVSQHLAKLRALNIVVTQREGTVIRYSLADGTVRPIIQALYERFCGSPALTFE